MPATVLIVANDKEVTSNLATSFNKKNFRSSLPTADAKPLRKPKPACRRDHSRCHLAAPECKTPCAFASSRLASDHDFARAKSESRRKQ